jgi:hypothetical protein
MKRISVITLLAIFMLVPILAARDVVSFGDVTWNSDNEFVLPLMVNHDQDLVAMDIPLEYSQGVTLTDVTFATRVSYFDAKLSNINEEANQVVLGLINMVYEQKPALSKVINGDATVASLTFRLDDLTLDQFEITAFTSEVPSHELTLVYNDFSSGRPVVMSVNPTLEGGVISLKGNPALAIPKTFALAQNYPNPFNPSTEMAYDLPTPGHVRFEIYNILGQNVKTLVNEYQDAGTYKVTWDGDDNYGSSVASGVYFYRVSAGEFKDIKKMVLMK